MSATPPEDEEREAGRYAGRSEAPERLQREELASAALDLLFRAVEERGGEPLRRAKKVGESVREGQRALGRWLRSELPNELGERLQRQASQYREELNERLRGELLRLFERLDPSDELRRLLSQLLLELHTEITFVPREGPPWVRPVIKTRGAFHWRKQKESSAGEAGEEAPSHPPAAEEL